MSIKEIKEKILADAQANVDKMIVQAESKAKELLDKGKREADNIKKDITANHKQEGLLKKNKILTDANLNAKKTLLNEKQVIIEKVFNKALVKIINMDDQKYCNYIEKLLFENIEYGNETISISKTDKNRINQEFIERINNGLQKKGKQGKLKLDDSFAKIKGGVIISSGRIKKNISLEFLIFNAKEKYEMEISRQLFG